MAERYYELRIPRVGADGKNYSTKIGVMFPWKNKDGFNLIFEALPTPKLNDKGEIEVMVMASPPYDEDKNQKN